MSNNTKTAMWIAVIAVVVVGGIWWWNGSWPSGSLFGTQGTPSNASPSQDLAQIDAEMSGLTADITAVDRGLNDQPVEQQSL